MSFGEDVIIGHKNILSALAKALDNKKFAHAHLFLGENGIGKSVLANYLGKYILGADFSREYVDLITWRLGKNKRTIGVDEVRSIIEEVNKRPYEGENKVIIVYNMDRMTIQAQNTFLKTIEEPPSGVYIFLLCEDMTNILDTIKSRCQIHKLKPLINDEITLFIRRKYGNISSDEEKVLVSYSAGIPGKVEKFLEESNFKDMRDCIINFLVEFKDMDKLDLLQYENIFNGYTNKTEDFFQCFLSFLRDVIIYKETGHKDFLINIDKINELEVVRNKFSFTQLNQIIDIINQTIENLSKNLNSLLVFSDMLLKIQEA